MYFVAGAGPHGRGESMPNPQADIVYAVTMLLAVAVAVALARWMRDPLPLTRRQRLALGLGAFCGAMIGAKLPFVLADWNRLLSGRAWLDNGKTLLFGMAGGYLGVEIAKAALGIRIKTGDSLAVPVAAAIAVGRLACVYAGCCFGTATDFPWGIDFGDGIRRHPTQLYEALFHASAAGALFVLRQRGLCRGQLIKLYFLSYFAFRFLTEWIRPESRLWLDLTFYQWTAVVLFALFVGLWVHDARSRQISLPSRPSML